MALRIRKNGKIVCAASHKAKEGDVYIDDLIHETLAGVNGMIKCVIFYNKNKDIWEFKR